MTQDFIHQAIDLSDSSLLDSDPEKSTRCRSSINSTRSISSPIFSQGHNPGTPQEPLEPLEPIEPLEPQYLRFPGEYGPPQIRPSGKLRDLSRGGTVGSAQHRDGSHGTHPQEGPYSLCSSTPHYNSQESPSNSRLSNRIVPTRLADYRPTINRKPCPREIALLELACGYRKCSDSVWDKMVNYYLVAVGGVITFIILSLDPVDQFLTNLIPNRISRLIFKVAIIFIVVYLLDRWIENWRRDITLCQVGW